MDEHRKSIFEFMAENHPEFKKTSVKFKRKASQYGREVVFYRETFIDYKDLPTKDVLNKLYPKPKPPTKSMTIIFE